jgi:hypothetical protein
MYSPSGDQWVSNRKDEAGIYQMYLAGTRRAEVCITCADKPNGPKRGKHKIMQHWHSSGRWIIMGVEREKYDKPIIRTKNIMESLLLTGMFVNMWAARPDGSAWHQLSDFGGKQRGDGYTGPNFTPDGRQAVWAQIIDGNVFKNMFGRWELILADFREDGGLPRFSNLRNITPAGANWVEPGNFSPDGRSLLITADIGMKDPQGQDQFILNITTGSIRNVNNTPNVWDEHGVYSPDGEKIFFMSSYPFREEWGRHTVLLLKAEFMLMNKDGSGLRRITHFLTPGSPEYDKGAIAANGEWHPDGRSISAQTLMSPNVHSWTITFKGNCGNRRGVAQ